LRITWALARWAAPSVVGRYRNVQIGIKWMTISSEKIRRSWRAIAPMQARIREDGATRRWAVVMVAVKAAMLRTIPIPCHRAEVALSFGELSRAASRL